jgi:hypothetical protein
MLSGKLKVWAVSAERKQRTFTSVDGSGTTCLGYSLVFPYNAAIVKAYSSPSLGRRNRGGLKPSLLDENRVKTIWNLIKTLMGTQLLS